MNSNELKAFEQLQQCAGKPDEQNHLPGSVVRTGRQGVYYLHEDSSLSFQTLGAASVAVHAFKQNDQSDIIDTCHGDQEDDEGEERSEILSLCYCLDGVIGQQGQLHKQVKALGAYHKEPQEFVQKCWVVQSKIVDMYDICAYVHVDKESLTLTQVDILLQRSTKLRCQLLLATCAVFCPETVAQIQLHIRVQTALYVYSPARAET